MELRSTNRAIRTGSSLTVTGSQNNETQTNPDSFVLHSSLRDTSSSSRPRISTSPFRRVHFDLRNSEGNDSNNVATQTEWISYLTSRIFDTSALLDLREFGRTFWNSATIRNITDYLRELDEKPKTGYTYASGLSYDIHGNPRPVMPNMSRHSLDYYATLAGQRQSSYRSSSSRLFRWWNDRNSPRSPSPRSGSDSVALPDLDFAFDETSPEPASAIRQRMTSLFDRIVKLTTTTTTTTTTTNVTNNLNDISGRITPESRSGSDQNTMGSGFYTTGDSSMASSNSQSSFHNGYAHQNGDVSSKSTPHPAGYVTNASVSVFEQIRRRIIDIANTVTTTTTETVRVHDRKKRRGACGWWPFCLLLAVPLLLGLIWAPSNISKTVADKVHHVKDALYAGFLPYMTTESSEVKTGVPVIVSLPEKNETNHTVQIVHVPCDLSQLPLPKNCCDDVDVIKSQVALILNKLESLERRSGDRDRWMEEREAIFDKTKYTVEELQTILIRLEKDITVRQEIVPHAVRERESFTLEEIRLLIARMIKRYDEDKIGEPDHALESAGATVISTRCTEEHKWGYAQYSLFGIPLWSWTTSPRLAIQDGIKPGQCWAFKGDQGYLVVKLAGLVRPTSFTIEHLPKSLSPTGRIDSAPKDFEVLGLVSEQGPPVLLGKYSYEDNDQSLQNFQVQTKLEKDESFSFVELRITSNHGHPDYTCLYRFRVHGALVQGGR